MRLIDTLLTSNRRLVSCPLKLDSYFAALIPEINEAALSLATAKSDCEARR